MFSAAAWTARDAWNPCFSLMPCAYPVTATAQRATARFHIRASAAEQRGRANRRCPVRFRLGFVMLLLYWLSAAIAHPERSAPTLGLDTTIPVGSSRVCRVLSWRRTLPSRRRHGKLPATILGCLGVVSARPPNQALEHNGPCPVRLLCLEWLVVLFLRS